MGRQAHVTRLALGRSPFGPPLRDENGNFILGPHAHDNDASGYEQQFDDHGHPQNRSSRAAERRLRKAQNDVLATVGVVVKKGEERKSKWERLEDGQKLEIICDENETGGWLLLEGRVLGALLPWSITSMRKRLMTFSPYSTLPITDLTVRECHVLGLSSTFLAGLPFHILSTIPLLLRYYAIDPNVHTIVSLVDPWRSKLPDETRVEYCKRLCLVGLLRCIELPLLAHATLQSLQIVPLSTGLNWRSFVPFSPLSPFMIPTTPTNINAHNIVLAAKCFFESPLCLYTVRDYLRVQLRYRLYGLFRQLLPKPDRPDATSIRISYDREAAGEGTIAGMGYPWPMGEPGYEKGRRYFGPRSFFGALRLTFPPIYNMLNALSRGRLARSRGRLTPLLDRQLRTTIRYRYWYDRVDLTPVPRRGSPEDMLFRRQVVGSIFKFANLDPVEELVDAEAWTNDVLGPKADVLRVQGPMRQTWDDEPARPSLPNISQQDRINTDQYSETVSNLIAEAFRVVPQSDAVIIQASDGEVVMFSQQASTDTTNVAEMDNIRTLQATEVPLEALIQGMRELQPDAEHVPHPNAENERPASPSTVARPAPPPVTPAPGILRARSLTDPQVPVLPPLRHVRRPTETDDSLAAISETLRAEAEALQSPRPSQLEPVPTTETQQQTLNQTIDNERKPMEAPLMPMRHRQFRVTNLSNYPADSLAWHASSILTSLILWPVEAMWLRSVAVWAVQNPAMNRYVDPWWAARLGFGVLGRPLSVLGLGTWFGGSTDTGGRLQYTAWILLTFGLEAMVRGAVWESGVWCVRRWKGKLGWGQF